MPVRIRNAIEGKRKRGENVKVGKNEAQANGNSSSTGRWKADAQSKIVELPGSRDDTKDDRLLRQKRRHKRQS